MKLKLLAAMFVVAMVAAVPFVVLADDGADDAPFAPEGLQEPTVTILNAENTYVDELLFTWETPTRSVKDMAYRVAVQQYDPATGEYTEPKMAYHLMTVPFKDVFAFGDLHQSVEFGAPSYVTVQRVDYEIVENEETETYYYVYTVNPDYELQWSQQFIFTRDVVVSIDLQ